MSANKAETLCCKFRVLTPAHARISFLLLLIIVLLKLPLTGSLWLDESITAWITKDHILAAIERATDFQGQSPLFFMIEWFVQLIAGSSELALRLVSIISAAGSLAFIFFIARRFNGALYAWIAVSVLLSIDAFQVAAVSARPYAPALFFSVAAVWALFRWEDSGRYRYSILYLAAFLLSVYFQYLFAAMLAVHALHIALHFKTQRIKLMALILELLLTAALLFPAFLHMVDMSASGHAWQFVPRPTVLAVARAILPPVLLVCTAGALLFGLLLGSDRGRSFAVPVRTGIWLAFWYLFPPLLMLVLSIAGPTSLFLERYYLYYTPAVALVFAALPFALKSSETRGLAIAALFALLVVREADRSWRVENWRGAAEFARSSDSPVLLYSGLAESKEIEWLMDARKQPYLLSPLQYYGVRTPIIGLPPPDDRAETAAYFDAVLKGIIAHGKPVLFMGLEQKLRGKSTVDAWVERLSEKGYKGAEIPLGKNSAVRAVRLTRE